MPISRQRSMATPAALASSTQVGRPPLPHGLAKLVDDGSVDVVAQTEAQLHRVDIFGHLEQEGHTGFDIFADVIDADAPVDNAQVRMVTLASLVFQSEFQDINVVAACNL